MPLVIDSSASQRVNMVWAQVSLSNLKVRAKFGLCSNCSQKLDECSLARNQERNRGQEVSFVS